MPYELEEIKHIRKKLGLTQFELAKRAGVSQSLIAKTEAGRLDPTYTNAKKIFTALDELESKKELKAGDIMNRKIISVSANDDIKSAIQKMKKFQISQMPVLHDHKPIGLVSESIILEHIADKKARLIKDIMEESPPIIPKESSSKVVSNLLRHYPMVLVSSGGELVGLITKADLLGRIYR
jgi:predicted transcriptional regulator